MVKIKLFLILILFNTITHAQSEWFEVSKSNNMSIMANIASFEEGDNIELEPAISIKYKTSNNPSFIGTIFLTKADCKNGKGSITVGYYKLKNEPLNANTVVFSRGEFKSLTNTTFNTQDKTGFNPLAVKLCSMIASMPRLIELVNQGNKDAQFKMAGLYLSGYEYDNVSLGVNNDLAFNLYEKSALQGHSDAQFTLGEFYYNGQIVQQNKQLALQWFEKSESQGNVNSKISLAKIYLKGDGVAKNKARADFLIAELKASGNQNLVDVYELEETNFSLFFKKLILNLIKFLSYILN